MSETNVNSDVHIDVHIAKELKTRNVIEKTDLSQQLETVGSNSVMWQKECQRQTRQTSGVTFNTYVRVTTHNKHQWEILTDLASLNYRFNWH